MQKENKEKYIAVIVTLVATFILLISGINFFNPNNKQDATNQGANVADSQGTQTTDSVLIEDETLGQGTAVKDGDTVSVNYVGALQDGTVFDNSFDRGEPITFTVGAGQLIKGFDLGVVGMRVGGKRKLTIPASLGYGSVTNGPIPANSTIVFEVQLEKIGE